MDCEGGKNVFQTVASAVCCSPVLEQDFNWHPALVVWQGNIVFLYGI